METSITRCTLSRTTRPRNIHVAAAAAPRPVSAAYPRDLARPRRYDAVADVKRALEARFEAAWGLAGRPRDRDGCRAGWELVAGAIPLSAHFFVGDYALRRGDVVHAVVRRRG